MVLSFLTVFYSDQSRMRASSLLKTSTFLEPIHELLDLSLELLENGEGAIKLLHIASLNV